MTDEEPEVGQEPNFKNLMKDFFPPELVSRIGRTRYERDDDTGITNITISEIQMMGNRTPEELRSHIEETILRRHKDVNLQTFDNGTTNNQVRQIVLLYAPAEIRYPLAG